MIHLWCLRRQMPILNNVFKVWAPINIQTLADWRVTHVVETAAANRFLWLMGLDTTTLSCQLSIKTQGKTPTWMTVDIN